jgi:hypothetical protein
VLSVPEGTLPRPDDAPALDLGHAERAPFSRDVSRLGADLLLLGLLGRLTIDAEGRHRAGLQALDADRLLAFLADPVPALLDPVERLVDLHHELPLPVLDPEHEVPVELERGAVGRIGEVLLLVDRHVARGPIALAEQLGALLVEQLAEELEVALAHDLHG